MHRDFLTAQMTKVIRFIVIVIIIVVVIADLVGYTRQGTLWTSRQFITGLT